ncbi:hypothetical protein H920_03504 [Fukomys damarensis]|uniref:Uncharacterized protein n=1 Tax=Fukomys damarensis TaxID=885580 RepID=A0A091EI06_FUKDA|nr:hypothetical protein H920_03504 [Fukomys damarensis]
MQTQLLWSEEELGASLSLGMAAVLVRGALVLPVSVTSGLQCSSLSLVAQILHPSGADFLAFGPSRSSRVGQYLRGERVWRPPWVFSVDMMCSMMCSMAHESLQGWTRLLLRPRRLGVGSDAGLGTSRRTQQRPGAQAEEGSAQKARCIPAEAGRQQLGEARPELLLEALPRETDWNPSLPIAFPRQTTEPPAVQLGSHLLGRFMTIMEEPPRWVRSFRANTPPISFPGENVEIRVSEKGAIKGGAKPENGEI